MGYFTEVILFPAVITIIYFYGNDILADPAPYPHTLNISQTQITTSGPLTDENGTLIESGYSTTPLKLFDQNNLLTWQKLRLKKIDYYDIVTDEIAVSFALADITMGGEVRVNYFNFNTRETKAYRKLLLPIIHTIPKLSSTSYKFTNESPEDNIFYEDGDFKFVITNIGSEQIANHVTKQVSVSCSAIDFTLEYTLSYPVNNEGMIGIIPFEDPMEYFLYTMKIPNGIVEGTLRVGNEVHQFAKENAGGFFEWGRGIWPYNTYWAFARAQGFIEKGKRFSLNLASGYVHNETAKATEDAFFIDNKLYKLEVVEPKFDSNNLMNPMEFKTSSEKKNRACEIIFAPNYIDSISSNYLFIKSDFKVVYGQFSGWVSDDKGKQYKFENVNGYVEVAKNKW